MKKFTFFIVFLMLQMGSIFGQNLSVVKFITPLPNANVLINTSVSWTLRVKNNGTAAIPTGDTIGICFYTFSGGNPVYQAVVGAVIRSTPFNVGDSTEITFLFNLNVTPGVRGIGYAAIWFGHVPGSVPVLGANFNFVTSGIAEFSPVNKIYYSNGQLNMTLNAQNDMNAKLIVTNMNGQQLWNNNISLQANDSQPMSIYLGDLPKGIYIVNLFSSNGNIAKKFVVQ
jgi:hypothetical protein